MATFESSKSFTISKPISACWSFISNVSNVGKCIPGCEEVKEESSTVANIKVKLKVGLLSKSIKLKVWISESTPPNRMKFEGTSDDAILKGDVTLQSQSDTSTTIIYKLSLRSLSTLASTALAMLGKGLGDQQAEQFISCVKKNLETTT